MQDTQPLLNLLTGHFGWLPAVISYVAALKLAMTLFENRFAHWIADKLNAVAASADQDDDEYLREIFAARSYRIVSFALRMIGFRFPTLADLERAVKLQQECVAEAFAPPLGSPAPNKPRAPIMPETSYLGLLFLVIMLAGAGCAAFQKNPDAAERVANHAAYDIALKVLEQHPELRPELTQARDSLRVLQTAPALDALSVIEVLQALPVLETSNAQIALDGGELLIFFLGDPAINPKSQPALRQTVKGLADGLDRRLVKQP